MTRSRQMTRSRSRVPAGKEQQERGALAGEDERVLAINTPVIAATMSGTSPPMSGRRASGPAALRPRQGRRDRPPATRTVPELQPESVEGAGRIDRKKVGDDGSATIWTVGAISALFLVASVVLAVGAATATRHRVAGAADLAALAAADYAPDGEQAACGWARWVTDHMRVRLVSCRLDGWDALVQTSADPPGPLARFGAATAHARAGPADG